MEHLTVECPACGYCRETARDRIPPGEVRVTCPQCGARFVLSRVPLPETVTPSAPPVPPAEPPPVHPGGDGAAALFAPRTVPFVFTGTAREYFGIWIVNILLTIVTCGIYTPWAKVRKRRYFCGNTLLDDAPFDYLADPIVLLRGWGIAAVLFLAYSVGPHIHPLIGSIAGAIIFCAMPWVIVRSLLFNTRNTAHRNIRFGFRPAYQDAYALFIGLVLAIPLTLGLIAPYVIYRQKRFIMENLSYGTTGFSFDAEPKQFYWLFLKIAGLIVAALAAAGGVMALTIPAFTTGAHHGPAVSGAVASLAMLVPGLMYLVGIAYWRAALTNLVWNGTTLRSNRFTSRLRARDIAWLYFTNGLAIILSFGLMIPWASVRMTRYRIERLELVVREDLDSFVAARQEEVGAAGEEIGDLFGFDFSL